MVATRLLPPSPSVNAEGEHSECEDARDWSQRLSRLRRSLDIVYPMRVQSRGCCEHDEKRNNVRESHANQSVELNPTKLP
jgi:hypothetical protein